ncbi:Glycosyl hydrolases family 16 [Mucilaginibacter pineti]|uniref:Glycosyl hydrolases family 16 n=1 Tax=Mucilaginibacter pineti TaxID=1391627 RepID=A0A1G7E5G7_9SPHI|nr:glycoside hydrolase family 16 protein [Mucilaginibacter pineti]SDE58911.1 Glycosyl hydrolases family 16 [Mucilaginibacter pineti]
MLNKSHLINKIKQVSILTIVILTFKINKSNAQAAVQDSSNTYSLIWHDEFDGDGVNPLLWNFETGNLGTNHEKQFYKAENATVKDGFLVITAKKESVQGQPYISARLNTKGKFAIPNGRIEAYLKCPMGKGLWPAFWMLGNNIDEVGWPKCGEIDIMEHVNADSIVYGTIHWDKNGHEMYGIKAATTPGDFHLYAVEWDKNEIRWYVDKIKIGVFSIKNGINNTGVFRQPFYILLNFAVGGDFPGRNTPIDESLIPAKMEIDYVRVYEIIPRVK